MSWHRDKTHLCFPSTLHSPTTLYSPLCSSTHSVHSFDFGFFLLNRTCLTNVIPPIVMSCSESTVTAAPIWLTEADAEGVADMSSDWSYRITGDWYRSIETDTGWRVHDRMSGRMAISEMSIEGPRLSRW